MLLNLNEQYVGGYRCLILTNIENPSGKAFVPWQDNRKTSRQCVTEADFHMTTICGADP